MHLSPATTVGRVICMIGGTVRPLGEKKANIGFELRLSFNTSEFAERRPGPFWISRNSKLFAIFVFYYCIFSFSFAPPC